MARTIEVLTPENIPLTMEPAGMSSRFGAVLVDMLVQIGIAILGTIIGIFASIWLQWSTGTSLGEALLIIGGFILLFGYFIFFESIWNGQTPGKRAFGLRVVRDGGRPVDFFSVAIRNLVRIADFLPVSYALGAGSIFFSPQYKRLGDMAAGTVVIREPKARSLGFAWNRWNKKKEDPAQKSAAKFKTAYLPDTVNSPADTLMPEEQALMRRFAIRRFEMTPDDAERLGYRIVVPLVARLNLTFVPDAPPHYADLISTLVADMDRVQEERDTGRPL